MTESINCDHPTGCQHRCEYCGALPSDSDRCTTCVESARDVIVRDIPVGNICRVCDSEIHLAFRYGTGICNTTCENIDAGRMTREEGAAFTEATRLHNEMRERKPDGS